MRRAHPLILVSVSLAGFGCSESIVERQKPIGGSCLACHDGITDVHPFFALACVDCHGGNDKLDIKKGIDIRDQDALKKSHVLPRDARMWFANGIDDDGDGLVDETAEQDPGGVAEFFDGTVVDDPDDGKAERRKSARFEVDSEINHDLNYLRFLNPGDLRVAEVSCGGHNRQANPAMVCHAETVYDVRRSIMTTNAGVVGGALYGNGQRPHAADYSGDGDARFDALAEDFDARDPRIGRTGYTFDFDAIDDAYDRDGNAFDTSLLRKTAQANSDPEDDTFEAVAAPLFKDFDAKDPAGHPLDPGRGLTRTGHPLEHFDDPPEQNRAVDVLQYVGKRTNRSFPRPGSALERRIQKIAGLDVSPIPRLFDLDPDNLDAAQPMSNPVDAALRDFRAYHLLTFIAPGDNFPPDPGNEKFSSAHVHNNHNPFGRFSSSGCTACHIEFDNTGVNQEKVDVTVSKNGHNPGDDNPADRFALPTGFDDRLGQKAYPRFHRITTAVQLQTCAACHGFVTRVDFAVEGKFELETDFTNVEVGSDGKPNFNNLAKVATSFTTPAGQAVNIFENLADFDDQQNPPLVNSGEHENEDKNGNGVLDPGEDLNGDGVLDIPDRVNRSASFDGRQSRLVYGGGSGAVHLTDVHIDAGFACSDCHVTSAHGDGNMYTRNWDAEPMECEDCHGTPTARASLTSSGPNGGDRFDDPLWKTVFGKPWLEVKDGKVIEHSRTRADLEWVVPQLVDEKANSGITGYAHYAHNQKVLTSTEPGEERDNAHIQDPGKKGGLECYTCHSSWQPNCMTCHLKMDLAKAKQEIWFGDDDTEDVFFQLFSYTRSPFYLGKNGDVENNKVSPYRSIMQVHLSVVAGNLTLLDNAMLATESGLSSEASNPYFPHTVRTLETKSCARCHTLVNAAGHVENDTFVTEATGQGSGRYMNIGDWAVVATGAGFVQVDVKKEAAGLDHVTFPGFDFDAANFRTVPFAAPAATDVALVRGVSPVDGASEIADVALVANANGVDVVDVTGRDNAGLPPTRLAQLTSLGAVVSLDVVDAAASQSKRFVALSADALCTVDYSDALVTATARATLDGGEPVTLEPLGCVSHGLTGVTKVRLHGRFALVAHDGGVAVFTLDAAEPGRPEVELGVPDPGVVPELYASAAPVRDVAASGRFAFAAEGAGGVEAFDIGPSVYPLYDFDDAGRGVLEPVLSAVGRVPTTDARGVAIMGSTLLVADGAGGLRQIDVSVPAELSAASIEQTFGAGDIDQATAVVVATEPTRTFAVVADGTHGIRAVNVTRTTDIRTELAAAAADKAAGGTAERGFRLSPERWDPLTPFDAKPETHAILTFDLGGATATALARGLSFDNIADQSGRKLRDSFSIGATVLDEGIASRMRSVLVQESDETAPDVRGDGLGCVVLKGDAPPPGCR